MDSKLVNTPVDPNTKLLPNQGEPFAYNGRYRMLVGKLNYLTITQVDISFVVSMVSQFLDSTYHVHWDIMVWIIELFKEAYAMVYYMRIKDMRIFSYYDANWASSWHD